MKHSRTLFLLTLVLLLLLTGCGQQNTAAPTVTEAPTVETTEPLPDACVRYDAAVAELEGRNALAVSVTSSLTRRIGATEYTEESTRHLTFNRMQTDRLFAFCTETCNIFGERIMTDLCYKDDVIYITTGGAKFYTKTTQEDFLADQAVALHTLDKSLYGKIESDGDTVRFLEQTAQEVWIGDTAVTFLSGSAEVTMDGESIKSIVSTQDYLLGTVPCSRTVTVKFQSPENTKELDMEQLVPKTKKDHLRISDEDLPVLYQKALASLSYLDTLQVRHSLSTSIGAFGYAATLKEQLTVLGGENHIMEQTEQFSAMHDDGAEDEVIYGISYRDGKFTDYDGTEKKMDLAAVQSFEQQHASQWLPGIGAIIDLEGRMMNGFCVISFACGSTYGDHLQEAVSEELFDDRFFLRNTAGEFTATTCQGSLSVDPYTLLPVGSGFDLFGAHVNDLAYPFACAFDSCYNFNATEIHYALLGEMPVEDAPAEAPTPLFYKVTGQNGSTLWLLGTIHLGDARTDLLPEAVLTAFENADALAVEFDINAFTEALETDEALQQLYSEASFYTDGTSLADHLDRNIYPTVMYIAQAVGARTCDTPYLRACALSDEISGAMLATDYSLTKLHGVDATLLRKAKAMGKEILDVESAEFQMNLFAKESDALQQFILLGSCGSDRDSVVTQAHEQYDAWCRGDKEAMEAQMFAEPDFSNATQTDIDLHNRYMDLLLGSRNNGMHDVALSYLKGDKTVFFAVGIAHLLGEDGLVESLQRAGYTVEPITY